MALVNVDLSEYDAIRNRVSELEEQVKELKEDNASLKQNAKVILRKETVIETASPIEDMEEKLNIAEILKDKPVGLKLYSPTFGCIRFNGVYKDKVYFYSEDTNAHSVNQYGKMYDGGECIIFPSKEMRDWAKFSWKKGDVLANGEGDYCVFK